MQIFQRCVFLALSVAMICQGSAATAMQYKFTTLATFAFNGVDFPTPFGRLVVDSNGNLYGTTYYGGAHDMGTIFEVAAGTHALTTLVSFDGVNGSHPYAGLLADGEGNFYGTTVFGGPTFNGNVFKMSADTHEISTLASFNEPIGFRPHGGLVADSHGNLYGTTLLGPPRDDDASGFGTVFEVAHDANHTLSTLATFDGANGAYPFFGLTIDAEGNLYGTTYATDYTRHNFGTLFEVVAGAHALHQPIHIRQCE